LIPRRLIRMGLFSFLLACFSKPDDSPFQQKGGQWHYRDTPIAGSEASSFVVLSKDYAKDARRVYFGDTYRKGQEYFAIKHSRVEVIDGADAATFRLIDDHFARDARRIYADGRPLRIADPATFAPIPGRPFARDSRKGYYHGWEIPGSSGPSFDALDDHYGRDAQHVFFCDVVVPPNTATPQLRSVLLQDADVATFTVLDGGYARDAARLYYQDRVIDRQPATFAVMEDDYVRTATQVFYRGSALAGANAATFSVITDSAGYTIGTDGTRRWRYGALQP
jgi:DKNYY family